MKKMVLLSVGSDLASFPPETLDAHFGEFQIMKRLHEVNEELNTQSVLKVETEKRIRQNEKDLARQTQMQEKNNAVAQTSKYTQLMKEYLTVKSSSDILSGKLDALSV